MAKKEGGGSLRQWSKGSYSVKNGRAASSVGGTDHATDVSAQIGASHGAGQKGAPGTDSLNRSGSADPGRRKWGGSEL